MPRTMKIEITPNPPNQGISVEMARIDSVLLGSIRSFVVIRDSPLLPTL